MDDKSDTLIRIKEAARRLALSAPTLYAAMDRGDLPYVKYRRSRRIRPDDLEQFVRAHITIGPPPKDDAA